MSGEYYERAIDSAAEMRELTIIRHADHFVHLVDGRKLASEELRHRTHSIATMFMRRCFEEQMLGSDARVDILLTKWDIVVDCCGLDGAQDLLERFHRAFIERFAAHVARLRVTAIAARPHYKSPLEPGFGLSELFRSWVDELPRQLAPRMSPLIFPTAASRPFDTFAVREAPDIFEKMS